MDALILLVDAVVLFIDDDKSEVGVGQEQRRARPGDAWASPWAAACHTRARWRGLNSGVPFRRPNAEARRKLIEKLRRQRDRDTN